MNSYGFFYLSSGVLFLSLLVYKRYFKKIHNRILFGSLFFLVFAASLLFLVSDYFTGNGIDFAVIYHLRYGLTGAGFWEYWKIILISIMLFLFGILVFILIIFEKKPSQGSNTFHIASAYSLLFLSLFLSPASHNAYAIYEFTSQDKEVSDFDKYYKAPRIIKTDNKTRNLVLIYAESLERTYFDEDVFPGLITGLKELEKNGIAFTNIIQLPSTWFTIGGIVASQCGIPLFAPSHSNGMSSIDKFLPGANCLSNLLHNEGYYLAYYGGADLSFAGKGKFFSQHQYDDVYGESELESKLEDKRYRNSWGLFDDTLFSLVYKEYEKLSEENKSFGLFTLTLDTHHPKGHPSQSCQNIKYSDGSNPILNAVACSDFLITKLVNKILESQHAKKTTIVITSDHLALRNTASGLLGKKPRKNMFIVISPDMAKPKVTGTLGSTMDIAPTILPFLGYEGTVGLGRNLLESSDKLSKEIKYIHGNLNTWQSAIHDFWEFPEFRNTIQLKISEKSIHIDDRVFKFPILIELNKKLATTLRFPEPWNVKGLRLIDYVKEFKNNTPYLWIDTCYNMRFVEEPIWGAEYCLIEGMSDGSLRKKAITRDLDYSYEDLYQLVFAQSR